MILRQCSHVSHRKTDCEIAGVQHAGVGVWLVSTEASCKELIFSITYLRGTQRE